MRGGIILATTKIWKVVKRLDHVVNYAKDNKKTANIEFNVDRGNYEMIVAIFCNWIKL